MGPASRGAIKWAGGMWVVVSLDRQRFGLGVLAGWAECMRPYLRVHQDRRYPLEKHLWLPLVGYASYFVSPLCAVPHHLMPFRLHPRLYSDMDFVMSPMLMSDWMMSTTGKIDVIVSSLPDLKCTVLASHWCSSPVLRVGSTMTRGCSCYHCCD